MDHLSSSTANLFSSVTIDRAPEYRLNSEELSVLADSTNARFLPVLDSQVLVSSSTTGYAVAALTRSIFDAEFHPAGPMIYLGRFNGGHHFAIDIEPASSPHTAGHLFGDLRQFAPLLPDADCALLGYARAMVHWQRTHRHCGRCGTLNEARNGGHVMRCTAKDCLRQQFPRTDPAIIVLVQNGARALFGRQAQWPKARYSTIAGFVEPGESAEQAVVREVSEETGVEVVNTTYHSSQPWPFPGTLMLGYHAKAGDNGIVLNDHELDEAKWLSRAEIEAQMRDGTFVPPTPTSISFRLIETWFDQNTTTPLRVLRKTYSELET